MVQHRLSRDQVIWSFGPDLQPVLEVEPGDVVTFETNDCFSGQIQSEDDLVTDIDLGRINSATGPVSVRGAEPGDSLVAEILGVRPIEWGVATLIPGFGQLDHLVDRPLTRLFEVRDGMVKMNERVSFPAKPMVGVVGVATGGETLATGHAGQHGGNLDDHWHGTGARIFFPVRQPGGMFAVGDMHASMGDGEICFTGVEIAGEVDIRFELLKGKQATWPVTELRDCWVPHASAGDYADALALVSEEAASLGGGQQPLTKKDKIIKKTRSRMRSSSSRSRAMPGSRRRASRPRASGRSPASRFRRSRRARDRLRRSGGREVRGERVGALFPPLGFRLLRPGVEDQAQLPDAFLVGSCGVFGALEAAKPVGDERGEGRVHRGRERFSCVGPVAERDREGYVSGASPAGSFHLLDDLVTARHARLERPIRRWANRWRGGRVSHASLGELTNRIEPVFDVPNRLHHAPADGLLDDEIAGRLGESRPEAPVCAGVPVCRLSARRSEASRRTESNEKLTRAWCKLPGFQVGMGSTSRSQLA